MKLYSLKRTYTKNGALIKGRMFGHASFGWVMVLSVTLCYWGMYAMHQPLSVAAACGGIIVLVIAGFWLQTFSVLVNNSMVKVRIKFCGIPIISIEAPFEKVVVQDTEFSKLRVDQNLFYTDRDNYMVFLYDDGYDDPYSTVNIEFKKRSYTFSAGQPTFEAELWKMIKATFKEQCCEKI